MSAIPAFIPRKEELARIEKILTSEYFDNPNQMARALLKEAFSLYEEREWHVVAMRNGGFNLLYGPFGTANAAEKALEKNDLGVFGECGVFPVQSAAKRKEFITESAKPRGSIRECGFCGHSYVSHGIFRATEHCVGKGCTCKAFVKQGR